MIGDPIIRKVTGFRDDKGRLEVEVERDDGKRAVVIVEANEYAARGVITYVIEGKPSWGER